MIIAERKPIQEILNHIGDAKKIMIAGCGACVTICFAGGQKEVQILASSVKISKSKEDKSIEIIEVTPERQCEEEFVVPLKDKIEEVELVVSLACGVGVQTMVDYFPDKLIYPGVNTTSFGRPMEMGVYREYCAGCGNCILHLTGGICPVARCSKSLMNGPCGGSENGKCEVDPQKIDCAWQLIYDRLKHIGKLDMMEDIIPIKDWSTARDGGVRTTVLEHIRAPEVSSTANACSH